MPFSDYNVMQSKHPMVELVKNLEAAAGEVVKMAIKDPTALTIYLDHILPCLRRGSTYLSQYDIETIVKNAEPSLDGLHYQRVRLELLMDSTSLSALSALYNQKRSEEKIASLQHALSAINNPGQPKVEETDITKTTDNSGPRTDNGGGTATVTAPTKTTTGKAAAATKPAVDTGVQTVRGDDQVDGPPEDGDYEAYAG